MATQRASPRFMLLAIPLFLVRSVAFAENIDPNNDGSKYAWAENLGWINAQPGGPGGPGVEVSDSDLMGWAWSENAGWISLSCTNLSCAGGSYGVTNDGCGTLAGYAWSENGGWINFAPATCGGDPTCGVKISPTTGIFSGRAWSEDAGWITFSSGGPNPYRVETSWRRTVPLPVSQLALSTGTTGGTDAILTWTMLSGATEYDIVQGDLNLLHSSGGNFQVATQGCLVNDTPGTSFTQSGNPSLGDGFWFLVRGENCGGAGRYGGGSEDTGISASGNDCAP